MQAFRYRGESLKKMLSFPGMQDTMGLFIPEYSNPYSKIIADYVTSCKLQEIPDPKTYYDAVVMAVNQGMQYWAQCTLDYPDWQYRIE